MWRSYYVDGRYHYAPHIKYLDQVMFIVINGFFLNENDILGNEGRSVKVWCINVDNYEKIKEISYDRVYGDYVKITIPKLTKNIVRQKEQKY